MSVSFGAAGTVVTQTNSLAVPYPSGITADQKLLMVIGSKPTSANGASWSPPSGWTLVAQHLNQGGYGTTLGADTGNTSIFIFEKTTVTGSESGSVITFSASSDSCWGVMLRFPKTLDSWDLATAVGSDSSAGNVSITFGSDPGVKAGDYVLVCFCDPTNANPNANLSAETLTQTGITFGTLVEIAEPCTSSGNNSAGVIVGRPVSSGVSSAAPVFGATAATGTNARGPAIFVRLRDVADLNPANFLPFFALPC